MTLGFGRMTLGVPESAFIHYSIWQGNVQGIYQNLSWTSLNAIKNLLSLLF